MGIMNKLIEGAAKTYETINEWLSDECPKCGANEAHIKHGFIKETLKRETKWRLFYLNGKLRRRMYLECRVSQTCPVCSHTWQVTEERGIIGDLISEARSLRMRES